MTFDEFIERFQTEEQCRDYLYQLRWPDGFVCPRCGHTSAWKIGDMLSECGKCGKQTSVIAGTIFQDTRKPLRTWFMAIWWVTAQRNGASAAELQQILGLGSYQTAWTWLHKIRTAMADPRRTKLRGTVEVDECYINGDEVSGRRANEAAESSSSIVIIGVEVLEGKNQVDHARMKVVQGASSESLLEAFAKEWIEPGSTVITNGRSGDPSLEGLGYRHIVHGRPDAEETESLLPHVQMVATLLRRWLLGTHQGAVQEMHLQAYLDEYCFRFNRRKSAQRGLLFHRLLENAMHVRPTTYAELTEHNLPG